MISLKRYLDKEFSDPADQEAAGETDLLAPVLGAYGSALEEMGNCSLEACPGLGGELKKGLGKLHAELSETMSREALAATDRAARGQLRDWGQGAARHYQQKAREVKELLIVMARTSESVGLRDRRCAGQIDAVTTRLREIASLDDLTEIRTSIEKSALELKDSIDRMAAEGKAAMDELKGKLASYEAKLQAAEEIAFRDSLTGLGSRLFIESQIEGRIASEMPFCVAMVDIDGFKTVNDRHGHNVGDELLKQFAGELRSATRAGDAIGRWGGDEFILLLNCGLAEAGERIGRLRRWICGNYTVEAPGGRLKLKVEASIGLAERAPGEPMPLLVARADEAMYQSKDAGRAGGKGRDSTGR